MLDTIYLDSGMLQGVVLTDTTPVVRKYIENKLVGNVTRFTVFHAASDETITIEQYLERTGESS
jgi:hypothetical protein